MILGQDMFVYPPIGVFRNRPKKTLQWLSVYRWVGYGVVYYPRLQMFSRYASRLLPKETDSKLVDQTRSWFDIESYGAYKQMDPRSAADMRAVKIHHETTFTMDPDITLVCSGLMSKLVYPTTIFRH